MRGNGTSTFWRGLVLTAIGYCGLDTAPSSRAATGLGDFLQTAGQVIRDHHGQGRIVTLHGTNLGGWLMQEDWMSPNGSGALPRDRWQTSTSAGMLTIDLGEWCTFTRVVLACADEATVEVSSDGRAWAPASVQRTERVDDHTRLELNQGYTARWIRVHRANGPALSPSAVQLEQCDDYSVRLTLRARFGPAAADELVRGYQRTWIDEPDLDNLQHWGLNVVRVPMNWLDFMTPEGTWKADAFARLDWLVSACAARSMYVILDLHAAPGGASPWASSGHAGDDGSGRNPNGFWTDPQYFSRTEEIWRRLAEHFRGNPTIAGYDLLNEPLYRFDERPLAGEKYSAAALAKAACFDRLYRVVRAVDPEHIIIIAAFAFPPPGTPPDAAPPSMFVGITPPSEHGWTNVVYQTHYYDMAHRGDHEAQARLAKDALADMARHQREWNVPIYAGEYTFYRFYDVWEDWMRGLDRLHISWTNWTYKVCCTTANAAGPDWGFFHGNCHPSPDVTHDSAATIAAKWGQFGTHQFQRNDKLIEVVSRCAAAAATDAP